MVIRIVVVVEVGRLDDSIALLVVVVVVIDFIIVEVRFTGGRD